MVTTNMNFKTTSWDKVPRNQIIQMKDYAARLHKKKPKMSMKQVMAETAKAFNVILIDEQGTGTENTQPNS